jgi:hypothetical protein
MLMIVAVIAIGTGTVFLLWGLKLIKIVIYMCGFAIGFFITRLITESYVKPGSTGSRIWYMWIFPIIIGIGAGWLARFCAKFSVFLVGFFTGGILLWFWGELFGLDRLHKSWPVSICHESTS